MFEAIAAALFLTGIILVGISILVVREMDIRRQIKHEEEKFLRYQETLRRVNEDSGNA